MTDLTPGGPDERRGTAAAEGTQQTDGVTEAERVREAKRAHDAYQDDRAAAEAARQDPTGHGASGFDTGTGTLDAGTAHTTGAAGATATTGTTAAAGRTSTTGTTGTTGTAGATGTTGTYATVVPDTTTGTTGTTGTHDTTGTTGTFAKPATTGTSTTSNESVSPAAEAAGTDAPSLLPRDASDELAGRLRQTVVEFVDRPQEAVEEADRLLEELANRFTEAVAERRRTLRGAWHTDDTGKRGAGSTTDTEQLRLALRDYRELAERLLHV
ncbi:hypothetical protein [Streptomyces galbus]|uniref:Uncharacterized protein n=1 Tax=Streptomyces galbus TaxID=33898 RepID=A0A4U5X2L1_STRGB|nr:hypothetical protein [Streptomyces galbus]TKT09214.1 hypothetical protein E4U92_11100 [Streptomyces galbus]GHD29539.1 hypothetical protein GCM10010335_18570 [Streptomyces galbus]